MELLYHKVICTVALLGHLMMQDTDYNYMHQNVQKKTIQNESSSSALNVLKELNNI
jgi:hypothetical protein